MDAEHVYLFRHGLLRTVAYELQLPSDRASLHKLVLEISEETLAKSPGKLSDAWAGELADHAHMAGVGAKPDDAAALAQREIFWRTRAAKYASKSYLLTESLRHWLALLEVSALSVSERLQAEFEYAKALAAAGHSRACVQRLGALLADLDNASAPVAADAMVTLTQALVSLGELTEVPALVAKGQAWAEAAQRPDIGRKLAYVSLRLDRLEGRFETALKATDELIKQSGADHDNMHLARLAFFRAGLLSDLCRHEEVLPAVREAAKAAAAAGLTALHAFALGSVGLALRDLKRPADGLPLMMEAVAGFRAAGDRRMEASFLGAAAAALHNLQRDPEALELAMEATAVARDSGNGREEHVALGMRARAQLRLRRFEDAAVLIRQACEIARSMSDHHQLAQHIGFLAVAKLACGDRAGFETHHAESLELLTTLQRPDEVAKLEREIADYCAPLGL